MRELFSYENVQRFNETDLQIYKYVLANEQDVTYMSIRELAKATCVSTSTVLRFCEKSGCEGYSEFKNRLKEYLEDRTLMKPGDDTKEILDYFNGTYTDAFEEEIAESVRMIDSASLVIFVGMGPSGLLAQYGARYFSNVGKFSLSISDSGYPFPNEMGSNTLVVALSVSGESTRLIRQLKECQSRHAKLLAIVNESSSTVGRMADLCISYRFKELRSENDCNLTSQVPVMFIIETLARRLAELS